MNTILDAFGGGLVECGRGGERADAGVGGRGGQDAGGGDAGHGHGHGGRATGGGFDQERHVGGREDHVGALLSLVVKLDFDVSAVLVGISSDASLQVVEEQELGEKRRGKAYIFSLE